MNKNSLENLKLANSKKMKCLHCENLFSIANKNKHENSCKKNPINQKECPVCKKMHGKGGKTCSYACSNKMFRSGENNGNWKEHQYRSTCFLYHKKECIVCGENKIVAVHHLNENHKDNRPENLIPLCPTHHQYVHSKFKNEVLPIIKKYLESLNLSVV